MIGNDIISLESIKGGKKHRNQRFLDKIFSEAEQDLILSDRDPEIKLWTLWAAKEAAYKAHQRMFQLAAILNPIQFEGRKISSEKYIIRKENYDYEVNIQKTSEYIYAYTTSEENLLTKTYFTENSKDYIAEFLDQLNTSTDFHLLKDALGLPNVFSEKGKQSFPISISHHGTFAAIYFPLINS